MPVSHQIFQLTELDKRCENQTATIKRIQANGDAKEKVKLFHNMRPANEMHDSLHLKPGNPIIIN